MKSAFFIVEMWQTGNIGSHNIRKFKHNKPDGYSTYSEAEDAMKEMYGNKNWELTSSGNNFSIMKLFWHNKTFKQ